QDGVVRLHRDVLYPAAPPFHARSDQPGRIRKTRGTARGSRGKRPRTPFPTGSTRIIVFFRKRTKNQRRSTYANRPLNRIRAKRHHNRLAMASRRFAGNCGTSSVSAVSTIPRWRRRRWIGRESTSIML